MRKSIASWIPAALLAVLLASDAVHAVLTFSVKLHGVEMLSSKDPKWDTVVVRSYVYIDGDSTFYNRGTAPLLLLDVRIDSASARKHYLAPKDSLEFLHGFFLFDTLTVLKTPFVAATWVDPLWSFQKEPTVEELRVSSLYIDLHPKVDTILIAGCPPGPTRLRGPIGFRGGTLAREAVPTTIYDIIGRPVWSGRLPEGEIPRDLVPEGVYLLVQGSRHRTFRIVPE